MGQSAVNDKSPRFPQRLTVLGEVITGSIELFLSSGVLPDTSEYDNDSELYPYSFVNDNS